MDKKQTASLGRRDFFRKASLGAGAAGAAAVGISVSSAKAEPTETKTSGYRETGHVKKFYELAKF